jgi:hypothetical protein
LSIPDEAESERVKSEGDDEMTSKVKEFDFSKFEHLSFKLGPKRHDVLADLFFFDHFVRPLC